MRRRKPKERSKGLVGIGELLQGALRQLGVQGDYERHRVEAKCREILGPEASRALAKITVRGGTVQLDFRHPIWMNEMNYRKAGLLKGLQKELPGAGLKALQVRLARHT